MQIIAHRGNLTGPNPETENTHTTIERCLDTDLDIEIDVRWHEHALWLGHDIPKEPVALPYLEARMHRLWVHAKDLLAAEFLFTTNLHWFWNETDVMALTSKTIPWCRQHVYIHNGITMVDGLDMEYMGHTLLGICTDYPNKHRMYTCP